MALSMKLAEQRLGISKVACVKTFGEPTVDGGEKVACRLPFSLIAQESRQAHGGAQFPRPCLLCSRQRQRDEPQPRTTFPWLHSSPSWPCRCSSRHHRIGPNLRGRLPA